jgi:hypothetical protein
MSQTETAPRALVAYVGPASRLLDFLSAPSLATFNGAFNPHASTPDAVIDADHDRQDQDQAANTNAINPIRRDK